MLRRSAPGARRSATTEPRTPEGFLSPQERRAERSRPRAAAPRAALALGLLAFELLALGACVTQRATYFEATPGPRVAASESRERLRALTRGACPRLATTKAARGEARFALTHDSTLAVTRAALTRSTGDSLLDMGLGNETAVLRLDAPASWLRLRYDCADSAAFTLEVR
jgi:hypothetical protein